ncbi:unnamed protein product [Cuscuta europaea]|uniref:Uncharacterized protein n=1 Tax=Cuscuta europaea TaxID=41803 RepID=A0A9P0YR14_CUSEU|nr:unnamed protein product [Cuscuta europaea]
MGCGEGHRCFISLHQSIFSLSKTLFCSNHIQVSGATDIWRIRNPTTLDGDHDLSTSKRTVSQQHIELSQIMGPRLPTRATFMGFFKDTLVSTIVYFINQRYDGVQLWQIGNRRAFLECISLFRLLTSFLFYSSPHRPLIC